MRRWLWLVLLLAVARPVAAATWVSGTVGSIEKYGDGQLLLVVVWTDSMGAQEKSSLIVDPGSALSRVQAELARRNRADVVIVELKVGTVVVAPVPPQPPVSAPPTDEQKARVKFFTDWTVALNLKPFADAGIAGAQSAYADALTLVKAEFVVAYVTGP